ncbi:enoyl-CoA hydratase-related protein [Casimicrobium huifangae]|uniref:enoyl-CoA hydratase-related protein n=1 Tax=Casimicrobium huifangae TaxID=2591109 RepID=UPI0012EBF395|nr:enoyl-CoA hydratase-related protein [Casimicrobium huifangae]
MTEHVTIAVDGPILTLTLNRPDKKNALTNAMYGALADGLQRAQDDAAIRCVLLRSSSDCFTAGNDLGDFAAISAGAGPAERHVNRFLHGLAAADKPIVAAVHGLAVGVGTTMLLHCDVVCVTEQARLTTPFVNLALVPEAASSLLMQARIGYARAYSLFALGEPVDGKTAVEWGLARHLVAPEALHAKALAVAHTLAEKPIGALRATKRLMRDAALIAQTMDRESAVFAERLKSPEAAEAFRAFAEKRAPDFKRVAS